MEGYSGDENIWEKIMEIDIGGGKIKTKQNIKENARNLRAKNCLYISPFDNNIFISDCESYKSFIN